MRQIPVIGLLFMIVVLLHSCTEHFEERNTSLTGLDELTPLDVRAFFPTAVYGGMSLAYQTGQNLAAGMYCQYYSCTQVAFSSHRYVMNQQWWANTWNGLYVNVISPLTVIIDETEDKPTMNAIARIWKAFMYHRYTDYFGPIPYSKVGNYSIGEGVPFDNQKDIYYNLFSELEEAATLLKDNIEVPSFTNGSDYIFNGDNRKWLKFANSLRLRLALRISFVEPIKARQEALGALAGGVMENAGDDAFMAAGVTHRNYLNYISAWNEFRMSANFESLFKGYKDPRMPLYFSPAVEDEEYRGGRAGLIPGEQIMTYNSYNWLSDLGPRFDPNDMFENPFLAMYAAETYFLRAEGALNGWDMGGTPKELYEKGIETSMQSWGITEQSVIDEYINGTSLPVTPAPESGWNTPPLTDIPVKFSESEEEQREQIGTQKWIALFPSDMEAWAEMRRTGYPRMYPLIHSDNPDMPRNQMIRRIVFPDLAKHTNGPAVEEAIQLLDSGEDKVSTRLWWDVKE
ncbi:SusD/RagB family nutrient-binding outer membrane lipoprotein [Membranihabitans maritimus]|uniref:SusD/RagB family nutrient-binding outer membrane lipoprotein n=1 Tax=Membranihabitans maritimus TaxID=2904244 RepID=UPI001F258CD8|nr:SusD/RagB family nutrient-binding outer membrane lipoprotein [Membranihabitans maritimus]